LEKFAAFVRTQDKQLSDMRLTQLNSIQQQCDQRQRRLFEPVEMALESLTNSSQEGREITIISTTLEGAFLKFEYVARQLSVLKVFGVESQGIRRIQAFSTENEHSQDFGSSKKDQLNSILAVPGGLHTVEVSLHYGKKNSSCCYLDQISLVGTAGKISSAAVK